MSVPLCRPCRTKVPWKNAKPNYDETFSESWAIETWNWCKSEDGSALFECAVDEIEARKGSMGRSSGPDSPNSLNIGGSSGPTRSRNLGVSSIGGSLGGPRDWAEVDKAILDFSAVFNNCRCLVNAWIPCGWSCSVNPEPNIRTTKYGQKPSMSTLQPYGCKDSFSPSECK